MASFNCPSCNQETNKLIIPAKGTGIVCPNCHVSVVEHKLGLQDTIYKDNQGTRVTRGKAWEIDNRTVSKDDGRTVINKITGREAQY